MWFSVWSRASSLRRLPLSVPQVVLSTNRARADVPDCEDAVYDPALVSRRFRLPTNVRFWLLADILPPSDLRPLYPRKQTLVALQSFGLKRRTSDVRFTPESGHKWLGRGMSAFDPKRTLRVLKLAFV